jgi:hypothetical protein
MEFTKVLIINKKLEENFPSLRAELYSVVSTLKQILLESINFVYLHTCRTIREDQILFWE